MGMYTEIYLGVDLKEDTPREIISWLAAHIDKSSTYEKVRCLAPEILRGTRFEILSGDSYYFYAQQHISFVFDEISHSYHFTLVCNIKNYDNEIQKLLDLIRPYLDMYPNEHMGHIRYEEDDTPTFLFAEG